MNILHIFNEENVSETEVATYKVRHAVRAIVFDNDNHIGLIHVTNYKYYELPGGGVEEGETLEEACIRECKEEIGCDVEIVTELGRTLEYRQKLERVNDSHCFIVKVVGEKGLPSFTEKELRSGIETVWVTLEEAVKLIKTAVFEELYDKYIIERSLVFLSQLNK